MDAATVTINKYVLAQKPSLRATLHAPLVFRKARDKIGIKRGIENKRVRKEEAYWTKENDLSLGLHKPPRSRNPKELKYPSAIHRS